MKYARTAVLVIVVLFLFAVLAVTLAKAKTLHQHGIAGVPTWYDGLCCNKADCAQTELGEIERRDDGWFVVPTQELIPFDDPRIKRSGDALMHRCVIRQKVGIPRSALKTRCLYTTEMGG